MNIYLHEIRQHVGCRFMKICTSIINHFIRILDVIDSWVHWITTPYCKTKDSLRAQHVKYVLTNRIQEDPDLSGSRKTCAKKSSLISLVISRPVKLIAKKKRLICNCLSKKKIGNLTSKKQIKNSLLVGFVILTRRIYMGRSKCYTTNSMSD